MMIPGTGMLVFTDAEGDVSALNPLDYGRLAVIYGQGDGPDVLHLFTVNGALITGIPLLDGQGAVVVEWLQASGLVWGRDN